MGCSKQNIKAAHFPSCSAFHKRGLLPHGAGSWYFQAVQPPLSPHLRLGPHFVVLLFVQPEIWQPGAGFLLCPTLPRHLQGRLLCGIMPEHFLVASPV